MAPTVVEVSEKGALVKEGGISLGHHDSRGIGAAVGTQQFRCRGFAPGAAPQVEALARSGRRIMIT